MKKLLLLILAGLFALTDFSSCCGEDDGKDNSTDEPKVDLLSSEYIPDPVFLAFCKSQMPKWDKNRDGILSSDETSKIEYIAVDNFEKDQIASLSGIEYFTGLKGLSCLFNQLTELDMSRNVALTFLQCNFNQLTSLDVSQNTALIELSCGVNQLGSLDVSHNTALITLDCNSNDLTSLDVSKCLSLTELGCGGNPLGSLDVSRNTALTQLVCGHNKLTSLNVSQNVALTELSCEVNQLTSLDVSNNKDLIVLLCKDNLLTSLDISNNTSLKMFGCNYNPGDGISKFPVKAWFDDSTIPEDFIDGNWYWQGKTIAPYYYTE